MSTNAYNLQFPDRSYALRSLEATYGRDQAVNIWIEACKSCGLSHNSNLESDLETIFSALAGTKGAIGISGKSLQIRLITYRTLASKG